MNSTISSLVAVFIGVSMMTYAGNAIARLSGFGDHGWLFGIFALGILLLSQIQAGSLRRKLQDLERRLSEQSRATS